MSDDLNVYPLPVSEWDNSLFQIVADMNGNPLNVHNLMANHPKLLKAWWNFRNYSVAGGDLGARKGELVILRISLHMKNWYEWGSHIERSLACGLTMEEIERVKQGGHDAKWSVDEGLILIAVDELISNRGLSKTTHTKLRLHFSVQQIMDIIAIHGVYVILGCMINTWGLELDQHINAKLPEGVTRELFEKGFIRK